MELKFLSGGNALRDFRREQYDLQKGICPVTGQWMEFDDCVVDHIHATKNDIVGEDGKGCIRGIIHRNVNSAEGSAYSSYKRRGVAHLMSYGDYLIALGEFINNPPLLHLNLGHPTEKPKAQLLKKSQFNRVLKYWSQTHPKKKKPVWRIKPKMKLTKQWEKYIKEADEIHYAKYK